jgi:hypothetical protein
VSKNSYSWNGNWNNDPWNTRWLGIWGLKKTNEQEHNSSGVGKGGKSGVGYNNVSNGHKGEDGEAGPGGKGGAGGRPAMWHTTSNLWLFQCYNYFSRSFTLDFKILV